MTRDTGVYVDSAAFETEVYPGVYWIPLHTLGKTRYTDEDMKAFVVLSPEEKRTKIENLYEAIQLYHASDFQGTYDNENHWIDKNTLWQTHKSPYEAVLSNNGCCATDTNWLAYFLSGKYPALYSFGYANEDGNGHITTCIKQNGWFYFIDLMMCRNNSQSFLCKENGVLQDLLDGEWAGFLLRCKDPVDFCHFHTQSCQRKNRPAPFCYYIRKKEYVTATGSTGLATEQHGVTFLIPKMENPEIVYCDKTSPAKLIVAEVPDAIKNLYD